MIRLSCQHKKDGPVVFVECSADSNAGELLDAFRAFMLACGYHPDTVNETLGEE